MRLRAGGPARVCERCRDESTDVSLKLFVAVDIDEPVRDAIAGGIELLRAAGFEARFISREKWHATLAFLGSTEEVQYGDVLEALRAAAACCAPFDLTLDTIGAFPSTARPRVVWTGASTPQPAYVNCAREVRRSLATLGFTFKDDAVPHVTICRVKNAAGPLPPVSLLAPVNVLVDSLTLYQSLPDGRTTRYAVREKFRISST
jgi:2'-5' RNA ligase